MKAKIRFSVRIEITSESKHLWDRYVFEASYFEYRIQHQVFQDQNNPVNSFWELLEKNPNAKTIPLMLSAAVENYVLQLGGKLKSITDVLGTTFFPFETFRIDLVSSSFTDASKHKIGLTFESPELFLLKMIDDKYLLTSEIEKKNSWKTFMLPFQPQLSISYYEEIDV